MLLNHPKTIPLTPVRGKIVFYETGPWCQKVWAWLLQRTYQELTSSRKPSQNSKAGETFQCYQIILYLYLMLISLNYNFLAPCAPPRYLNWVQTSMTQPMISVSSSCFFSLPPGHHLCLVLLFQPPRRLMQQVTDCPGTGFIQYVFLPHPHHMPGLLIIRGVWAALSQPWFLSFISMLRTLLGDSGVSENNALFSHLNTPKTIMYNTLKREMFK